MYSDIMQIPFYLLSLSLSLSPSLPLPQLLLNFQSPLYHTTAPAPPHHIYTADNHVHQLTHGTSLAEKPAPIYYLTHSPAVSAQRVLGLLMQATLVSYEREGGLRQRPTLGQCGREAGPRR